jgi:uncharacterized protein YdaU (DUF1376 family)
VSQTNVLDDQLKVAAASLRGYRTKGDATLISFWSRQIDRLLDERLRTTNDTQTEEVDTWP